MSGDIIETAQISDALAMANSVMAARPDARIGQIIGASGTGKTAAGHFLADQLDAVRICAWSGIGRRAMLMALARKFDIAASGTCDTLTEQLIAVVAGRMIIIDEANHLAWKVIEPLRIFVDEGGASLLLIGTDLLARTFNDARSQVYLAQMRRRIGAKRVRFEPISDVKELAAYILQPRFGGVSQKTAETFMKLSGGLWGEALELADACDRVMKAENITKLDDRLIRTAGAWMARHAA